MVVMVMVVMVMVVMVMLMLIVMGKMVMVMVAGFGRSERWYHQNTPSQLSDPHRRSPQVKIRRNPRMYSFF